MKLVKFLKQWPPYNEQEQAGFRDEEADRLVARGVCAYAEPILARAATALGLRKKHNDAPADPNVTK